jgi:poly-gamma-glutamate capsule biosynthesis protein CapA/YwtB (metallophosphatase superfamily)
LARLAVSGNSIAGLLGLLLAGGATAQSADLQESGPAMEIVRSRDAGSLQNTGRRRDAELLRDTEITVAITGDLIGPYQPVSHLPDARFQSVVTILKSADAAFGNQEGAIFDLKSFRGSEGAENGGGKPLAPRVVARDLRDIGLNLMSKANNHAVDWGIEGLIASGRSLDEAHIVHAGSGVDRAAAFAPAYLDLRKGRVALVAIASTFPPMAPAGPPVEVDGVWLRGRPGISALRDANAADVAEIISSVRTARKTANLTVFSIHAHETASNDGENPAPAAFLPILFHQAIDAGADVVVRHGPHALRGIEIYQGKPIFYGMASLFMGIGDSRRAFRGEQVPAVWDDGAVAVVRARAHEIVSIRIYPITIIREEGALLGAPMRASPADAQRILETLQRESAVYGTRLEIDNGVGVITVPTRLKSPD